MSMMERFVFRSRAATDGNGMLCAMRWRAEGGGGS